MIKNNNRLSLHARLVKAIDTSGVCFGMRRAFDACRNMRRYALLVFLFATSVAAGSLLAHMSVTAEAHPSPYIFSGNSVRMKTSDSQVIGEVRPFEKMDAATLFGATRDADATPSGVRGQVRRIFVSAQPVEEDGRSISKPNGLVHFDDGTVRIMTDGGAMPVTGLPSSSAMLPGFAHPQTGASVQHYASLPASETPLSFFQCTIRPESQRRGSQALKENFGLGRKTAGPSARAGKYRSVVERYAKKYNLAPELILGIMRTESNFNPFAVSPSQALGLMQVVPETAGGEVHSYLTGESGTPSADLLLQPERNIQYGTVYLHLLRTRYFQGVFSEASRRLLIIAAYNGGPGAVIRVFNQDHDTAIAMINNMTPDQVYRELTQKMPRRESRLYVDRVLGHMQSFTTSVN